MTRVTAGEPIEIVSDNRGQRLLVHGSEEVQVLAKKYIETFDLPAIVREQVVTTKPATNQIQPAIGQAANVRGYFAATMDELRVKEAALKKPLHKPQRCPHRCRRANTSTGHLRTRVRASAD